MADAEQFDGVAAVSAGDILIVLWQAAARVHRARWVQARVERIAERAPTGFVLVQLILPSSNPPDKACRDEASATFKKYRGVMRQMITVPLGDSLWTNIVRAIIRTAVVVTGNAAQHEVASSAADAIARIRARATPDTPSSSELGAAVDSLFRAATLFRVVTGRQEDEKV
jgi:hypothetical protein